MSGLAIVVRNIITGNAPSPVLLKRGLALSHHSRGGRLHTLTLARNGVPPSEEELQIVYDILEGMGGEDMKIETVQVVPGKMTGSVWHGYPILFALPAPPPRPPALLAMPAQAGAFAT